MASTSCLRAASVIAAAEQPIGVKPARSRPARAQPAVERNRGVRHQACGADLLDGGIPGAIAQPLRAHEISRQPARAHLEIHRAARCVAAQNALPRRLGAIGVGEIVAVKGRHGIGMGDEPAAACSRGHVAHDGPSGGAGRGLILGVRRIRVEPDDNEGAEQLHDADLVVGRSRECRRAADVGMKLSRSASARRRAQAPSPRSRSRGGSRRDRRAARGRSSPSVR